MLRITGGPAGRAIRFFLDGQDITRHLHASHLAIETDGDDFVRAVIAKEGCSTR